MVGTGRAGEREEDRGKETGRGERNTAYFTFYSRVPDSSESGAHVTVVNCCLDGAGRPAESPLPRGLNKGTPRDRNVLVFRSGPRRPYGNSLGRHCFPSLLQTDRMR